MRRRASSTVRPLTRSIISEADAWEMAHPLPMKPASSILPSFTRSCRVMSSPQLGLTPLQAVGGTRHGVAVFFAAAVLGNDLGIQFVQVHRPITFRTFSRFSSRASILGGVVDCHAGPAAGADAQMLHQRLGAVVSGPDGHTAGVQNGRYIVGMNLVDIEADDAVAAVRPPAHRKRSARGMARIPASIRFSSIYSWASIASQPMAFI